MLFFNLPGRDSQQTWEKRHRPSQRPCDKYTNEDTGRCFSARPRAVFLGNNQCFAYMDYDALAQESRDRNVRHCQPSSSSTSPVEHTRHPSQQHQYVIYNERIGYAHIRLENNDRWSYCRGRVDTRASSVDFGRAFAREGFDMSSSRNETTQSRNSDMSFRQRSFSSDDSLPRSGRRSSHSRDRSQRSTTPRAAVRQQAAKQEVQLPPPSTASDHPVAVLLAALDTYHPGKLVEWLQRRTTRLEDAPAVAPVYDEDLYEAMELQPNATASEIRKAYRRLALLTHPDKPNGDRRRFDRVARAYTTLSDPLRREAYDAVRRNGTQPRPPRIVLRSGRDVASDVVNDFKLAGDVLGGACQQVWASILTQTQQVREERPVSKAVGQPGLSRQNSIARMVSTAQESRRVSSTKGAERRSIDESIRRRGQVSGAEFL